MLGMPLVLDLPRRLSQVAPKPAQRFENLDYFCSSYKTIFAKIIGPAAKLVRCLEKPASENAGLEFESRPKNWGHCSESSLPRRCESRILHKTAIPTD